MTVSSSRAPSGSPIPGYTHLREQRFPLNLGERMPGVAQVWKLAKAAHWDPIKDIPWDDLDTSAYNSEQLYAARVFWSRRAWSEYTGLAESPTVLLRFAFEGDREPEIKFALASKLIDEARHVEASFLLAEKLGGYIDSPPEGSPKHRVVAGLRQRGMNPDYTPEAVLACWHCVSEFFAVDIFRARYEHTSNPVAKIVLGKIIADEIRHITMGWEYLAYRLPKATQDVRDNVRVAMMDVIENVELGGFHSSSMLDGAEPDLFQKLDAIVADAGLGAAPAALEHSASAQSLATIRKKAAALGIELPDYSLA
ncbi:MAG TPA: ferritin-like domain-containing protein [Candidatus Aquilonibacter sp.]